MALQAVLQPELRNSTLAHIGAALLILMQADELGGGGKEAGVKTHTLADKVQQ